MLGKFKILDRVKADFQELRDNGFHYPDAFEQLQGVFHEHYSKVSGTEKDKKLLSEIIVLALFLLDTTTDDLDKKKLETYVKNAYDNILKVHKDIVRCNKEYLESELNRYYDKCKT